jgi:uncharacterized protein YbjT (DUF2867 family)
MKPLLTAVAAGLALMALLAIGAGPASAYTYRCSARPHARNIVAHNAACATAGRVIKAYGTSYTTKRAAGFSCKVIRLDSRSNPVVRCRTGIATVTWSGV